MECWGVKNFSRLRNLGYLLGDNIKGILLDRVLVTRFRIYAKKYVKRKNTKRDLLHLLQLSKFCPFLTEILYVSLVGYEKEFAVLIL